MELVVDRNHKPDVSMPIDEILACATLDAHQLAVNLYKAAPLADKNAAKWNEALQAVSDLCQALTELNKVNLTSQGEEK